MGSAVQRLRPQDGMGALMPTQADLALAVLPGGTSAPPTGMTQADAALAALQSGAEPAQVQQPSAWERYGGELGRQVGLTVRHGVTGLTALPALLGNGLNSAINLGVDGVNALAGTKIGHLEMPTETIQRLESQAGLPTPKNSTERIVGDAASAMTGVGGTYALGQKLLNGAAPLSQTIGRTLTAVPGNQVVAAGSAGASGGAAREAGLGPWGQLAASLLGGAAGSLGAAGVGSAGSKLSARLTRTANPAAAGPAVEQVLADTAGTPAAEQVQSMQARTAALLEQKPGANPAAAARSADFRALGIRPTLGQITRDPAMFAKEQNLRGIEGIGDPLLQRFADQNQQLGGALGQIRGNPAETYTAGVKLADALQALDTSAAARVTAAYKAARASTGAQLDVPLQGLAQDYARVLNDFPDAAIGGVRNRMDELGLLAGTQRKVFNFTDAEDLLKLINAHDGPTVAPATREAMNQLRRAVKQAVLSADDQGGAFAQARQLAAQRFAMHEEIPAMDAAVRGTVAPDDFVRRFLIGGKTQDVQALAKALEGSPGALQEARSQVGGYLYDAAFGQNPAGDKLFRPEAYAKALGQMGTDKLGALFSPDEIESLQRIGRVGSFINARPSTAAVNTSNTGAMLMDNLQHIPVVGKALNSAAKRAFVARALEADLANTTQPNYALPNGPFTPRLVLPATQSSQSQ